MTRQGSGAVALLLFSCSIPVHAELVALAPVIVTATRTAETVDETLASVTVIDREEIERRQALSVQELLQGVPGVTIVNNGGLGKNTSVFLRGTESDHVLVLIDGVKVGSATNGQAAFQDIPVGQIERIEIVRGPRSSLYGSEAIGGVIQIFTRKGGGALTPYFSVGGGSHSTSNINAGISGGGDRGWFNLSLSNLDTQGFNACTGKPSPGGAGCFTNEPDADGYRNRSHALRAGYRFENGAEVDAFALQAKGQNEFDGSSQNESESLQQVVGGKVRFSPLRPWQVTLSGGQSKDESDNFKNGMFSSTFDTERNSFSFQNDISLSPNHVVTAGYDYQKDRVSGTTAFTLRSRDNEGLFAQYQGKSGPHDLQAAVRHDDNQQFGSRSTENIAYGFKLAQGMRLFAAYGTAFKAPTFNELFFPGFGNPDLQPEEAKSYEAGLSGEHGWGRWSLNAYQTEVDNLIAFDAAISAPNNIDKARLRGLEGTLGTKVLGWTAGATLTLLDPENQSSGANRGKLLPRRAEQAARLDLDRAFGPWRFGTTVYGEGRRFDDLGNTRRLGGYATVALRAEYALHKNWTLQAKAGNLFDKNYQTAAFFPQDGTNVFVTVRYQPAAN